MLGKIEGRRRRGPSRQRTLRTSVVACRSTVRCSTCVVISMENTCFQSKIEKVKNMLDINQDLSFKSRGELLHSFYESFHHCIENIPVSERDSIFNYNLFWHGYSMMEHEKLLQCNRVSVAYDLPTLMKEENSKPISLPKWIMVSSELKIYDSDAYFILNNYELITQFNYDRLYLKNPRIGNDFNVYFFRRKN